jgi:hypothetical protein
MRNSIHRRSHKELLQEIGEYLEKHPSATDYAIGTALNISFATRKKYCELVRGKE